MMMNYSFGLFRRAGQLLICSVFPFLAFSQAAWPAIAFVAANSASPGQTSTLSINTPTTLANDVMLAEISVRGGSAITITAPAGWTLINRTNNSTTLAQAVYYRVAGGAEPSSYSWTFSSAQYAAGGTLAFRGVDTASPIDVWSARRNGSSNNLTANGVVTTVADAMLVGLFANADGRSNFTPPAGMTERYDTQFGSGQDNATAISASDTIQTAAGASGNKVATASRSVVSVAHLIALRPDSSAVITPSGFNAFETSTAAGSVSGVIRTKVAASSFGLDVVALKTGGTAVETAFAGDVKLELVDASAGPSCGAYALIRNLGTLTFTAVDLGRKTLTGISEPNAWPNARVRMTYPTTGVPTITACSTDNFAIRPAGFGTVTVSDADSASAGTIRILNNTGASGGIVHKAGRPFTLAATALPATTTNYTGTPSAVLSACVDTGCPATLGSFSVGSAAVSGVINSTTATYSEVGAFAMQLQDQTFASVDAGDTVGNCSATGRYVCSAAVNVGRFVPDHFDLATASTPRFKTFNDTACPTRTFTYVGQPFGYVTLPEATITAKNAAGATTLNYAGALWKLAPAGAIQSYTHTPVINTVSPVLAGAPTVTETGGGVGSLIANGADEIAFDRDNPAAPFNADITLTMSIEDTAENGVPGNGNGIIVTTTPAVFSSIEFDSGNLIRFGQLVLSNALGSELLGLPVPIETRYWNGIGFVRNAEDHCTKLAAANVALSNWQRDLNACNTSVLLPPPGRFIGGLGNLRLSAPGPGNTGSVDLAVQLSVAAGGSTCVAGAATAATAAAQSWLQGRWSGVAYNQNPVARASFGLHRGSKPLIYLREIW